MSQQMIGRIVAAVALLAVLTLAAPAPASAAGAWDRLAPETLMERTWRWMAGWLGGDGQDKQGPAIDPDGAPKPTVAGCQAGEECDFPMPGLSPR
jgi:hypothetical protein